VTEIIIFISPGACSRVTMCALEDAGIPYDAHAVNRFANEQKGPEFTAINRKGKVPALMINGEVLTENAAIITWIARNWRMRGCYRTGTRPSRKAWG
jgi:glutathione S-transferase